MFFEVHLGWLLVLAIVPSGLLEDCRVYDSLSRVTVAGDVVSWEGSYNASCLRRLEVCWTYPELGVSGCGEAPLDSGSLRIKGSRPCRRFTVSVRAVGLDPGDDYTYPGNGYTGPSTVTGLKVTQKGSDVAALTWSPFGKDSCVTGVQLWICDNRTANLSTCMYEAVARDASSFELHGVEPCRRLFAVMRTEDKYRGQVSSLASLPVYLDSSAAVTRARATNVTHDSAAVEWRLSTPGRACGSQRVQLCLRRADEGEEAASRDCWSWSLGQQPGDSLQLADLAACTAYEAAVSLSSALGETSRTAAFTTPMHGEVIDAAVADVTDTTAVVTWSLDADGTDCHPDSMQVCYTPAGRVGGALCHSLRTAASRVRLQGLASCAEHLVLLTLATSVEPRPSRELRITTTSQGHPVLAAMSATAGKDLVRVEWMPAESSLQCVRLYNVSWYSSGDPRRTWQSLPTDTTSYTIHAVSSGQTYYVQVSAVFLDSTAESLSRHVDVPARSGSSKQVGRVFLVFCALSVFVV
ncbi:uncharacterized protein LOC134536513 [Bacillus rossius redtenbacheri]|uniref:uncharacterized protein LOC134536513 n=1 Tax=Bacillus rossius redtenbacheri TaxID=93214 RepID=UPI002FDD829E